MLAVKASNTNMLSHTVYVRLLEEGTDVFRPVSAVLMGDNTYLLRELLNYDEQIEKWQFLPGSLVICEQSWLDGEPVLLATSAKGQ